MRRSAPVELSTCHKVHLPPQISLSFNSVPRGPLGKCNISLVFSVLALCKNCARSIVEEKWFLLVIWAYQVSLFDFQRLEHVFLKTAIGRHCAGAGLYLYVLGPQSLSQRRAFHTLPLLEVCRPTHLFTNLGVQCHARFSGPIKWSAIRPCCQPERCLVSCTARLDVTARLHQQKSPHEVCSHKFTPPHVFNELPRLKPAHGPDAPDSLCQHPNSLASWHQHHARNLCPSLALLFIDV